MASEMRKRVRNVRFKPIKEKFCHTLSVSGRIAAHAVVQITRNPKRYSNRSFIL